MKKIESNGSQMFNVPNTPEGLEFIRLAHKFLNHHMFKSLRKRGRGKRPNGDRSHVSAKNAEWFAVYTDESDRLRKELYDKKQRAYQIDREAAKKQALREIADAVLAQKNALDI